MSQALRFIRYSAFLLIACVYFPEAARSQSNAGPSSGPATSQPTTATADAERIALPTLPPGVSALKFSEIFEPPGRYGLSFTEKARALDGKKVRVLGYMVRRNRVQFGSFLLAPLPVQMHDTEYGLADDLPPATLLIEMADAYKTVVTHTPGLMLLTGTLHLTQREEPDGRVFYAWIKLDPPERRARQTPNPGVAGYSTQPETEVLTPASQPATRALGGGE